MWYNVYMALFVRSPNPTLSRLGGGDAASFKHLFASAIDVQSTNMAVQSLLLTSSRPSDEAVASSVGSCSIRGLLTGLRIIVPRGKHAGCTGVVLDEYRAGCYRLRLNDACQTMLWKPESWIAGNEAASPKMTPPSPPPPPPPPPSDTSPAPACFLGPNEGTPTEDRVLPAASPAVCRSGCLSAGGANISRRRSSIGAVHFAATALSPPPSREHLHKRVRRLSDAALDDE